MTSVQPVTDHHGLQHQPCVGSDPLCPCQDGLACHYRDYGKTKAMPRTRADKHRYVQHVMCSKCGKRMSQGRLLSHLAEAHPRAPTAPINTDTHMRLLEARLKRLGYDLDELDKDNPYNNTGENR